MPIKPIDPEKWKSADKTTRERMLKAALGRTELYWSRDRGHPDAIIRKWINCLKNAGFKYIEDNSGNSPDGYIVTNSEFYRDSFGNVAEVYKYYGPTKDYNHFRIRVKVAQD